jgi:hypothetical protein
MRYRDAERRQFERAGPPLTVAGELPAVDAV